MIAKTGVTTRYGLEYFSVTERMMGVDINPTAMRLFLIALESLIATIFKLLRSFALPDLEAGCCRLCFHRKAGANIFFHNAGTNFIISK